MGILNFITGGSAKVQVTLPTVAFPSLPIAVKIHVTAADQFASPNQGKHAKHTWTFQARLEARGNDPDSGWKEVRVGANM